MKRNVKSRIRFDIDFESRRSGEKMILEKNMRSVENGEVKVGLDKWRSIFTWNGSLP